MVSYYLDGFLAGLLSMLVLGGLFLVVYRKTKRQHAIKAPDTTEAGASGGGTLRETTREAAVYLAAGLVLTAVVYAWITPIMPYVGTVEDKFTRSGARRWNRVTHYVVVNGQQRTVDKTIYEQVKNRDEIRHPAGRQQYLLNGAVHVAGDYAWNTAFWAGIFLSASLFLSVGAYVQYFRGLTPRGTSQGRG